MPTIRHEWALVIIGSADYIEGATRIQKYAFLAAQGINGLTQSNFYNDWKPSKFGPFSAQLAEDMDLLVKDGLVGKYKVKNNYDYWVDRFAVTPTGKERFNEIKESEERYINEIKKKIVDYYNKQSLMDVLHDVYYHYPRYAVSSTIKAEVGRKIYESDAYLNRENEELDAD